MAVVCCSRAQYLESCGFGIPLDNDYTRMHAAIEYNRMQYHSLSLSGVSLYILDVCSLFWSG